jgi:hypothetical protein
MTGHILRCPDTLPEELKVLLLNFADNWAKSPLRPQPSSDILEKWDMLIQEWIAYKDLPMLIRKPSAGRGQIIHHESGRKIIPADNTPAHWVFIQALCDKCPTIQQIHQVIADKSIPIAMILSKEEKPRAHFTKTRKDSDDLNKYGWNLAHIQPIGLKCRGLLSDMAIETLEQHFKLFMSPSNMFVVPLSWKAIGEIPEMITAIQGWKSKC